MYVGGRAFGGPLVKPSIPGIENSGYQEIRYGGAEFGDAVIVVECAADASMGIHKLVIVGNTIYLGKILVCDIPVVQPHHIIRIGMAAMMNE